MDDPARHLRAPHADARVSDSFANPSSIFDNLSITNWLNEGIQKLTGFNVIDFLVTPFTGDWEAFEKCGQALANAADCLAELGQNIQYSDYQLDPHWDGNAADAAHSYLTTLAFGINQLQSPLDKAADEYQRTSRGIWLAADTVAGFLKQACDYVLIALITAAASSLLVETGVGAVVGYALVALQVQKAIELINKAGRIITGAMATVFGASGALMALGNQASHLTGVKLPHNPYDNPAVP